MVSVDKGTGSIIQYKQGATFFTVIVAPTRRQRRIASESWRSGAADERTLQSQDWRGEWVRTKMFRSIWARGYV